jgi:outer membrane protein
VNYTHFSSVDLPEGVSIDRDSAGPALGARTDVPLGQGWLLNFDAKRVWLDTEVRAGGQKLGDFAASIPGC